MRFRGDGESRATLTACDWYMTSISLWTFLHDRVCWQKSKALQCSHERGPRHGGEPDNGTRSSRTV